MGDRPFRLKHRTLVAASVALVFSNAPAWANPTGPQVVNGAASFSQPAAGVLNVTNSPGSIIHWQGFSIGASEVTRFIQQSAASAVLNRVTGGNVSEIYGQLLSNGRVFLVNPGGIVVGPGAIVDTAGFVGSTLNMLDSDFLAGKLKFQGDSGSGSIINQGWIRTGYGGQVVLVAPNIENSGLIHTPGGELILAAGQKVTVSSLDHEGVQFEVQAPTDSVLNVGKLIADGGAVGVFAGTLKHSGEIRANSLVYDEAGRVLLKAQNEIQLTAGSATVADGGSGGSITVQTSGGATRVAGDVSAAGSSGPGGNIQLLGSRVAVVENSAVNASGATRGGRVLVGGDYQGANAAVQNSSNTFVGVNATLRADATQSGDGGRIVVWSDDKTQFYGNLSAQGGPAGGDGGFAEVSGKQGLVFQGSASLGSSGGSLGTLLLDPLDLYVFTGGGVDPTIINEATDFPANAATVSPATLAAITGNVALQASRYMRIGDPIALTAAGQTLTATVDTYTVPALPDPLALSSVSNRLDLGAGITTVGGAVTLNAPTIQSVAASPISIATSGGAINLTAASQIQGSNLSLDAGAGAVTTTATIGSIALSSITGSSLTGNAAGTFSTGGAVTTSGAVSLTATSGGIFTSGGVTSGGNVTMTAGSSVQPGTLAAGAGTVALTGSGIFGGSVTTTGSVTLTATSSSISTTVNSASSLTATSPFGISINSTTNLNVANVTAGATSAASLTTTTGSILGTGTTPTVKGMDVSLFTSAATGGGIGTAATPLTVDVTRNFTFRPNGDFNILLTGSGPIGLNAQFTPANTGTYSGTVSKSGSLTLNASADTSTVTVSSLNITSGFDQQVSFVSPSIQLSTSNAANLVVTSANVPTGDTVSTLTNPNGFPLPVIFTSAGNLTVNNYTRASGGLAKTTQFTASGGLTLGTIDASKDVVTASGNTGITVGSLISTGNISLSSFSGPVNAASDLPGVEVTSGGALTISARGIGTSAGFSNPLDLAANSISLTSNISGAAGAIGGTSPVIANTTNLTINARSGSTFNVSTGATSLTNLTVTANATSVGDAGLARVTTNGGADVYLFDANAGTFTFDPPPSTGRNITFTSTSGDIFLGATTLGTGNLVLTSENASILTNGNSISAAGVTLNAAGGIDMTPPLIGPTGNITATGDILLHGRTDVTTGTLNTPGQLTIDGNFVCFFCSPTISVGHIGGTSAPSAITMTGDTITTTSSITGAGNVTLNATGGALTLGSALTTADGKTVTLTSNGLTPFGFTEINAGATGTVRITASNGIQQTVDLASNGITAKTVELTAFSGPIVNTDLSVPQLDLFGTTSLSVNTSGIARFDVHGSVFTDLTIVKNAAPLTAPFQITNMGGGQSVSIAAATNPLEVSVNSPTALNFSLDTQGVAATDMTLVGGGIVTSGGNVTLTSGGGIGGGSPISSGAGNVSLTATGDVNVSGGITTTGAGAVTIVANNGDVTTGAITTGGGNIRVNPASAFPFCSTPPCNVTVSGSLNAGTGTIDLNTPNGSITGGSAITAGTFSAATGNGEVNLSGTITAPTVTLTAARTTTTANEGLVTAPSLATTTALTLSGDLGFNVASNTGFSTLSVATKGSGTGAVSLTATGQTYSFSRPATDLFGASVSGSAFEVVSVTAPSATATFKATDGILLVRGAPGEPNKIDVQNLTLQALSGGDIALQGNSANPLKLSNAAQSFSAGSLSTADILVRGKVTLSATGTQTFTASGNITVNADAGGGGTVAISAPTQSFLTSSAASKMEFLGGAASGERVTVTSTADQFVQTTSTSLDAFKLLGGSGADSSVTFTHSGSGAQTFQMQSGTLTVAGGSGANSFAKLEETGSSTQRICFLTFFSCNPIFSLNVLGGSGTGALAQVTSAGAQDIRVSGTAVGTGTTVRGGTGDGANALIQAATSQSFSSQGRLLVQGQGGPGAVAKAEILSGGSQTFGSGFGFGVGTVTVQAGSSSGSLARIAATGSQSISASGTLSLIAQGTESAPLSNASAIIEGSGQTIFALGGITLNAGAGTAAGSGTTSDAVLRNLGGGQNANTSGTLILDGGHQFSTSGIVNLGTGTQSVSSTGGITLRSDTDVPQPPHANAIVAIQNQPATAQTINTSGPLKLTNSGGGTVGITTAGDQNIFAQYIEVLTNPTTEVGENSSKISSAGAQKIFTQNLASTGFASLRVAALGTGDAAVESLGSQLIELDYPSQMQATNRDGRLIIGEVSAAGTSRVRAGNPADLTSSANQSIFARAITIQAGGNNTVSELKATGSQAITTLQGGIDVLGGSGNDSLAQIDPTLQTILSNGAINVIAGSGINAVAQIVANTGTTLNGQTILTTNGDITLTGGSAAGAGAFITNQGSSSFVSAAGEIFLNPGTAPGADAIINVGNGPGTLTANCGGSPCTLSPAGPSPTGGILANNLGSGSSGSSSSTASAAATAETLIIEESIEQLLAEIAPEPAPGEGLRRAPVCR